MTDELNINIPLCEWFVNVWLYVAYFLLLLVPVFLYLCTPTQNQKYLKTLYDRNWNTSYITDIRVVNGNANCPDEFTKEVLATWSGFSKGSCYCSDPSNANTFFFVENCGNSYKTIYTCKEITENNRFNITEIFGSTICVKRSSNKTSDFENGILGNNKYNTKDYSQFYSTLDSRKITIDNPVTEVVISDNEQGGYQNSQKLGSSSYYLSYKKMFSDTDTEIAKQVSLYDFNELIVNIHFEYEFLCSYIALSKFNPKFPKEDDNYLSYSNYDHCKGNTKFYYPDKFKRTTSIGSLPISSITSIEEYIATNSITASDKQLTLVAQKYFYGLGCPYKSSTDHISSFKRFVEVKNMSISIIVFSTITFIIGIVFLIFRLFDNCKGYPCTYCLLSVSLFFSLSLSVLMTICYIVFNRILNSYMDNYAIYCQVNYQKGEIYTTDIETQNHSDTQFAFRISIALIIIEALTLILLIIHYALTCKDHKIMFVPLPVSNNVNN